MILPGCAGGHILPRGVREFRGISKVSGLILCFVNALFIHESVYLKIRKQNKEV